MFRANVVVPYRQLHSKLKLSSGKLSHFKDLPAFGAIMFRLFLRHCAIYCKTTVVLPCKKTLYSLLTDPFCMAVAVAPLSWRKKFAEKIVF
jgi:hypothetical protein